MELARYAAHLRSTVEIFGVLTDPRVAPRPGSLAGHELAEARTLSSGDSAWGEERVRTAYQAALMSYTAALDEGLAMAVVITGGVRTAIPAVVLARSIAEVASQAWWLLKSGVGARGRVERLQCLRLRSAIEGERAAGADGIDRVDWLQYTETQVHSGFAHGEIFALWQGFDCSDDGRLMRPVVNEPTLQGAVAVATRALYYPAARLSDLFGLDRPPGQNGWVDEHDAVTCHVARN
jgi:hypothetical protein